ncbi:MAG: amidohydrolase family protein [Gemmatimonadota bacterium]|nr:amidohydrolase family protein [Gemmatimonadota bacterium]
MRRLPNPVTPSAAAGIGAALVLATALAAFAPAPSAAQTYDVVIRNGRVLDGTGNPFVYADVGIVGDEIVAVGDLSAARGRRELDASGQYVTPGFIGLHEHIDREILRGHGTVPNYVTQGFTTGVINADGLPGGVWPLSAQRDSLARLGHQLNLVPMVPHGVIRTMVMGMEPEDVMRPATPAEIEEMRALVRQGMQDGAFGLTTGLEYNPMRYSTEAEVQELAKVVGEFGGHFQAHMRSQGRYPKWQVPSHMDHPVQRHVSWLDAVMEVLNVGRAANIPVMLDHIHPKGPREWGVSRATTQLIDRSWAEGYPAYINMHSYEGYSAYVTLIPRWALARGEVPGQSAADDFPAVDYTGMMDNLRARLADPATREMIRGDVEYEIIRQGGADNLLIVDFSDPAYIGKTLAEVEEELGMDHLETAIWLQENGLDQLGGVLWMAKAVGMIDIEEWMRQDYTAVALDRGVDTGDHSSRSTHPGEYGTSGRLLEEFVFDRGTITLPHAIRSMTGLSAQILGLTDRGRIAPGMKADLVVFDPARVGSDATYLDPYVYQRGMTWVLVNGQFVVENEKATDALPGVVLTPQAKRSRPVSE